MVTAVNVTSLLRDTLLIFAVILITTCNVIELFVIELHFLLVLFYFHVCNAKLISVGKDTKKW